MLYFDLLPDELFVNIIYYFEIIHNIYPNEKDYIYYEYLLGKLMNKWPLLFSFSFPDIYINYIVDIDYSSQDYEYFYWIYLAIKQSYDSVKYDIENNLSRNFKFSLNNISNLKLRNLIINKDPVLKDILIHTITLNFSNNKFQLEVHGLPKSIGLTHIEGLTLAVCLLYDVINK